MPRFIRFGSAPLRIACIALVVLAANAADRRPTDFTLEERASFEDRSRQFERMALPIVAHHAGAAGWVDENRIIYSTREIVGQWKAESSELAKVVLFDVRLGTVQETPYRGNLVCYSPTRMLISQPKSPHRTGFNAKLGDQLLAGRFGEALEPLGDARSSEIAPFDCSVLPMAASLSPNAPIEIQLLPGDGLLRVPRGRGSSLPLGGPAGYEQFDAAGRSVRTTFTGAGHPRVPRLYYVPWLKAYFSDNSSAGVSEFIWADGRREAVRPPPLLASFAVDSNVGVAPAIPTRAGVIFDLEPWFSYWRMQGLYLLTLSGALQRIDGGSVPIDPRPAVASDGCRIFYLRREGEPSKSRTPFVPTVMNVCQGARI